MEENELTIEQTNALRLKLGLKPIAEDGKDQEDGGENNTQQEEVDADAIMFEKQRIEKEAKQKEEKEEKKRRTTKLVGKTLGDQEDELDDTEAFISNLGKKIENNKQKAKKDLKAKAQEYELDEIEVRHAASTFKEGQDTILTLQDQNILSDNEDALIAVEHMDETKAKKEKSKKRTMEQRQKEENAFLDEEEAESFVLSNKNHHKKFELPEDMKDITQSLDYEKTIEIQDYVAPVFKKKAKAKRNKREVIPDTSELTFLARNHDTTESVQDTNEDDEDLQLSLARQRAKALRSTRKAIRTPSLSPAPEESYTSRTLIGLTSTSEFVRQLGTSGVINEAAETRRMLQVPEKKPDDVTRSSSPARDADVDMEQTEDQPIKDEVKDEIKVEIKTEPSEDKQDITDDSFFPENRKEISMGQERGLGHVLARFRQKGVIQAALHPAPNALMNSALLRKKKEAAEAEAAATAAARSARQKVHKGAASGWEKEQSLREQELIERERMKRSAADAAARMANYKPDVQLIHRDEYHRPVGPKEAFKAQSHAFHGKGSGKGKTDKKLRQIAQEKLQHIMPSGDTPLGIAATTRGIAKSTGVAHVLMNVPGSRGGGSGSGTKDSRNRDTSGAISIVPTPQGFYLGNTQVDPANKLRK